MKKVVIKLSVLAILLLFGTYCFYSSKGGNNCGDCDAYCGTKISGVGELTGKHSCN